jgi:hypothetical protein
VESLHEDARPLRLKSEGGMAFHQPVTKLPSIRQRLDTSCDNLFSIPIIMSMEFTDYGMSLLEACSSPSSADILKDLSSSPLSPDFYGLQQDSQSLGTISRGQLPSLCMQWNPYLNLRDRRRTGILTRNGYISP